MKDKYGRVPIYEFLGLKSKMYSICSKNIEKSIIKGHNSHISHKEYRMYYKMKKLLDIK